MASHRTPKRRQTAALQRGADSAGETTYARRVASKREAIVLEVAGREVAISNPSKVYFPEAGITKLDVVRYYLAVAEGALRGAGGRPNVLVRYADGIHGEFFYQKRAPTSRPPWIEVVALRFPSGRAAEEVVPRDAAALAWMANLGCLELHPHPVRAEDLDHPDELRVDLDPMPGIEWSQLAERGRRRPRRCWPTSAWSAGRRPRARAASTSTCASSGAGRSRRCGAPRWRWRARSSGARPTLATSKWWKEERHGVFLDYNQNAKDRTVAGAYSVRPKPDAPRLRAGDLGGALRVRARGLHAAHHAGALRRRRRPPRAASTTQPCSLDAAARAVGAAGGGRPRRRAVAAALREAGRRAAARPAFAPKGAGRSRAAGACRPSR